jgi:hypothetical protein
MAEKLKVYNAALLHLGERKLASLTESRKPRRVLDDAWDDARYYCLEQGIWNFGIRSVQLAADSSVTPAFGYTAAFSKPSDWVRTAMVADNEKFEPQLQRFIDEGAYWWADCTALFVRYVSKGTSYGLDLGRWTQSYADYVAAELAWRSCKAITGEKPENTALPKIRSQAKSIALANDAMNEPPGRMPTGTWVGSRAAGQSWTRR